MLAAPALVQAQGTLPAPRHLCGTAHIVNETLRDNPSLQRNLDQLEAETQAFVPTKATRTSPYIIPVVIHVVHNFGSENISRAQVLDAIRILNEDFRKMAADTGTITARFKGLHTDANIEFRLAGKDPNGNCTDGITRTVDPVNAAAFNESFKDRVYWPTNKYLNIWICGANDRGAGGYAFYPGSAPKPNREGIVCNARQFGSIGASSSSNFSARTISHEVGHYFNLRHTWGNSNEPGLDTNCGIDDGVTDTPNTKGVTDQSCPLTAFSCDTLIPNVENYMDYSNCGKMFTAGQVARMTAALNAAAGFRNNLWTDSNLAATGVTVPATAGCAPRIDFIPDIPLLCIGNTVRARSQVYNISLPDSTLRYKWVVQDGVASPDTQATANLTFFSPGQKRVALYVVNQFGQDSMVKQNIVTVADTTPQFAMPFSAGFDTAGPSQISNWVVRNTKTASQGWQATSTAAYNGTLGSIYIDSSLSARGNIADVITGVISIDRHKVVPPFTLSYSYAYAPTSVLDKTRLFAYYSTNCGENWRLRQSHNVQSGTLLATAPEMASGTFVPAANQWQQVNVSLPLSSANRYVQLRFAAETWGSNRLYLDQIMLNGTPVALKPGMAQARMNLHPMPVTGETLIELPATAGAGNLRLLALDGRLLGTRAVPANTAVLNFSQQFGQLPAGVYLLQWQGAQGLQSHKVVVQ